MQITVQQYKNRVFNSFHVAFWLGILLALTLTLAVYGQREQDDFALKNEKPPMLILYVVLNWFLNALFAVLFLFSFSIGLVSLSHLVYAEAVEAAKQEILASGAHMELDPDEEQV